MTIRLPVFSLIKPILAPATSFVVIDENGTVLFHGDSQRNNRENFFAETDHDRQLRSAVLGREASFVSLRYWGADQRAFVRPMRNVPWTLIVFRDKRLARTLNIETVVMTVLCLALYAAVVILIFLLILLFYPTYRAPFLWPKDDRLRHYKRLMWLLGFLTFAFIAVTIVYRVEDVLLLTYLIPFQAMSSAYLVMHPNLSHLRRKVVLGIWLLLQFLFLYVVAHAGIERDLWFAGREFIWDDRYWVELFMILLGAFNLLVFLVQEDPVAAGRYLVLRQHHIPRRSNWRRWYLACAFMLLGLITVVPTVGFFKVSYRFELEALLKYGQLSIAETIQQRIEAIASSSTGRAPMAGVVPDFFRTRYSIYPDAPPNAIAPCDGCLLQLPDMFQPRAHFLQASLPQYSEDSVAMRELHHDAMSDGSTTWWGRHPHLRMNKILRNPTSSAIAALPSGKAMLLMQSYVPRLLPSLLYVEDADRNPDPPPHKEHTYRQVRDPRVRRVLVPMNGPNRDPVSKKTARTSGYLLLIGFAGFLMWTVVRQFASRIFLYDVDPPKWYPAKGQKLRASLGDNIFLTIRQGGAADYVTSDQFTQYQLTADNDFKELLSDIDKLPGGRHLLLEDFRPGLHSDDKTLTFLESLLEMPNSTVVLASSVSPLAILSSIPREDADGDRKQHKRWSDVLAAFIWLDDSQFSVVGAGAPSEPERRASSMRSIDDLKGWRRVVARFADRCVHRRWLKLIAPLMRLVVEFLCRETGIESSPPSVAPEPAPRYQQTPPRTSRYSAALFIVVCADVLFGLPYMSFPGLERKTTFILLGVVTTIVGGLWIVKAFQRMRLTVDLDDPQPSRWHYFQGLIFGRLLRYANERAKDPDKHLPEPARRAIEWLDREAKKDRPFLMELKKELIETGPRHRLELQTVIDEFTERAGNYYVALWANCSEDEKLLLMQLARDRVINGSNRKVVRRLMARRLIERGDNLRVFNHTFRVYVVEAAKREGITTLESQRPRSAWERLRTPLATIALLLIPSLFATQKDLFNATTAILAGLAAAVPAVVSLVGLLTENRVRADPNL